ncbi:N-acetylneuraminate synthase [Bacteriovorax sp. PP10]|uniref:N-acetylneuraminate synthase n=1 Tax=Bacteriovorax antarcticus TaxID=3088717 RepID=A0ABU5VUI1_9BACT|nr:N-acetylneuraminate synthase [Bacteriovorax sp. PP10]MEA9356626.1 N-acetylneuraminate synthase [Bacteriovorax sp. PP10]
MENKSVLIIAEAGVNHNGDIGLAKELIDLAVEAGVDIVKFQTFKSENLVTKNAAMAGYQVENTGKEDSQLAMLKKLELQDNEFKELQRYCVEKKIRFFSTGFDIESLIFLKSLNMGLWKVPSGEITNLPYLEFIGRCNEPVILSTGMATLEEVEAAIKVLVNAGTDKKNISVLHCNTDYPTRFEDVHLNAMKTMRERLGVEIGYSDHTAGVEISVAAVALGAKVIEKHFTIDKNLPGPDHKASLDPNELKALVIQIRNIEKALGRFEKIPTERESKNIQVARKSIVAKADIKIGDVFTMENLTTKRPGTGISPMKWHEVLGTKAAKNYQEDDLI